MAERLLGKVAVVTGAASGMGKAIAIDFVKEGAKIVATDMNEDGLKELDEVAYIRFASVYRQFKDVQSFMEELQLLLDSQKKPQE